MKFQPITWDNFEDVINLQLTDEQKGHLASNVYSLAQSYVALLNDPMPAMTFAIEHEEVNEVITKLPL